LLKKQTKIQEFSRTFLSKIERRTGNTSESTLNHHNWTPRKQYM